MSRRELLRTGDLANGKELKVEAETKVAAKPYLGLSKIHPMDYRHLMLLNVHNFGYPTKMHTHFLSGEKTSRTWLLAAIFWGPKNHGSRMCQAYRPN